MSLVSEHDGDTLVLDFIVIIISYIT